MGIFLASFVIFLLVIGVFSYFFGLKKAATLSLPVRASTLGLYALTFYLAASLSTYGLGIVLGLFVFKGVLSLGSVTLASSVIGFLAVVGRIYFLPHNFNPQRHLEKLVKKGLILLSLMTLVITFGILFSLSFETLLFFDTIPLRDFFFGTKWSSQAFVSIEDGRVISEGFGMLPLFWGTFMTSLIAILLAAPLGLLSAIYLSEYATRRGRGIVKPLIEMLAGVPTVVYGYFAVTAISPFIKTVLQNLGVEIAPESALAVGLTMGFMIMPILASLANDALLSVPQDLRSGGFALGATKREVSLFIVLPAATSGVVSAFLLSICRGIGETMIVVMAAGTIGNLTLNPLEAMTTVTVQIVTLLTGDQAFNDPRTLSAFALGFTLFFLTFILNSIAFSFVKAQTRKYA